jgi:Ca2+-binding RTX toxin-like protein
MTAKIPFAISLSLAVLVWHPAATPVLASAQRTPACTITGTNGDDNHLRGTSGPDVICALSGDDEILGLGGDDVIYGGDGQDIVMGGRGDDRIYGDRGGDLAYGGDGNDRLFGKRNGDDLRGNRGRDRLVGGRGNDGCLSATDGQPGDRVVGGPGHDRADRDPGDHLVSVEEIALLCYAQ